MHNELSGVNDMRSEFDNLYFITPRYKTGYSTICKSSAGYLVIKTDKPLAWYKECRTQKLPIAC